MILWMFSGAICEMSQQKCLTEANSRIHPGVGFQLCPLFHPFCPSFLLPMNQLFILFPKDPRPRCFITTKDTESIVRNILQREYKTHQAPQIQNLGPQVFSHTFKEKVVSSSRLHWTITKDDSVSLYEVSVTLISKWEH